MIKPALHKLMSLMLWYPVGQVVDPCMAWIYEAACVLVVVVVVVVTATIALTQAFLLEPNTVAPNAAYI